MVQLRYGKSPLPILTIVCPPVPRPGSRRYPEVADQYSRLLIHALHPSSPMAYLVPPTDCRTVQICTYRPARTSYTVPPRCVRTHHLFPKDSHRAMDEEAIRRRASAACAEVPSRRKRERKAASDYSSSLQRSRDQ